MPDSADNSWLSSDDHFEHGSLEIEDTVQYLETMMASTFDALEAACQRTDFSQDAAATPPWNAAAVLEHVSLANHFLLLTAEKQFRIARRRSRWSDTTSPAQSNFAPLKSIGEPGAFAWDCPTHMVPTGSVSQAEVLEKFKAQRELCLHMLSGLRHGEGTLVTTKMSVQSLGKLNWYEWLYFLLQHARRHLRALV